MVDVRMIDEYKKIIEDRIAYLQELYCGMVREDASKVRIDITPLELELLIKGLEERFER